MVTGGAAGIGRAVVQRFQKEGARVVIADFARERGEELARSMEGATYCYTDVRDEATIKKTMETAYDRYGKIDVLVILVG